MVEIAGAGEFSATDPISPSEGQFAAVEND